MFLSKNFTMYIGHTYYFNVNATSNRNLANQNIQLGFALNDSSNNYTEEYNFNNSLTRSGEPGLGIGCLSQDKNDKIHLQHKILSISKSQKL